MKIQRLVGQNIQKYRRLRGWSQEELADRASIHRTYISGVERGIRNPTITLIAKIASALEVPPHKLLESGE